MFMSEWREFPSAPCLAGKKKNLITARVSMLLKSRASLTYFRACFLPGRAKDLSAPRYNAGPEWGVWGTEFRRRKFQCTNLPIFDKNNKQHWFSLTYLSALLS